jgi:hypothetical protein
MDNAEIFDEKNMSYDQVKEGGSSIKQQSAGRTRGRKRQKLTAVDVQ